MAWASWLYSVRSYCVGMRMSRVWGVTWLVRRAMFWMGLK